MVRKLDDSDVAEICAPVFGNQATPSAGTLIWDLNETEKFLLRIALAMLGSPNILFVDDIEQVRNSTSRAIIWERLAAVANKRTDVVVAASSLDSAVWEELDITPHVIEISAATAEPATETTPLHELIKETV